MEHTIIIGAGPCGIACALALQDEGIDPLIIEKGNIVNTIYHYPTHQTFFSSSDKLEIGNIPFINEKAKPVRLDALAYYREVANRRNVRIHPFEEMKHIEKVNDQLFQVVTDKNQKKSTYHAKHIIIATGYYDKAQLLHIPGETLPKVTHYFKEAHPYYQQNVVVIGGKNSAVDTTIELQRAGANVTVLYRGSNYSTSIKPWILPAFESLVRRELIQMEFNAEVNEITEDTVTYTVNGTKKKIKNDYVFAMTGYMPDIDLMSSLGIEIDLQTGRPTYNPETYETNVQNMYVAGVVISGYNGNETFIENGRHHGEKIANYIASHSVQK